MNNKQSIPGGDELLAAIKALKQYFIYAGIFSIAVNLLMLVPILFMMQIFQRILSSGSTTTLGMLTLITVFLLLAMGGFEWVRSMILVGASNRLEQMLRGRVFNASFKNALASGESAMNAQPNADLTALRQFMTGNGLFAFFDAPWFPIYVAIMFFFHTWFGVGALLAGIVMVTLAVANEKLTNKPMQKANVLSNSVSNQMNGSIRNAEVIAAMGMTSNIRMRQEAKADEVLKLQSEASRKAGFITSMSKALRVIMQSSMLAVGALLALRQEISPGMMIGGSLLLARALAPIDMMVANWKNFSVARAQYDRLKGLLQAIPAEKESMSLPVPNGHLKAEQITVAPPGSNAPVIRGVSLNLEPGEALGIIGPSAAGKSSLARALMGIWPCMGGTVRLDGADISSWDRQELGPHVGYLPQDIELFNGTVSENISRFGELDADKIVAAAKTAGVHDMILRLPDGYDTVIGAYSGILTGGQRQRIALARALYGNPKLLILDEPNSNLDDAGEKELVAALTRAKDDGCTIVVVTHRPLVLNIVDKIVVMTGGVAVSQGPKDEILGKLASVRQKDSQNKPQAMISKSGTGA